MSLPSCNTRTQPYTRQGAPLSESITKLLSEATSHTFININIITGSYPTWLLRAKKITKNLVKNYACLYKSPQKVITLYT